MRPLPPDLAKDAARAVSPRPGSSEEQWALERIDELRDEEQDGLTRVHPDSDADTLPGPTFYTASASTETRKRRRAEARRYWSRHTTL